MERRRVLLVAVLAYGVLNAILYAGLLPLWDGIDEPFHYAYVSRLWRERRWQTPGRATLSAEIAESLALAPGSYLVKRNVPTVIPFNEYFARSDADRRELRRRLGQIDPRRAAQPAGGLNYEAQQAPLAYLVLAPFDILWRNAPLLARILRLRLLCGLLSTIATGLLVYRLGGQLGLAERWRLTAVYLALSSQVFYAATAHVGNDWPGIPLFTLLIVCAIAVYEHPTAVRAALFAAVLAAGLLTKAYFLAAAPFAAGLAVVLCARRRLPWRRAAFPSAVPLAIAAAWYARNLLVIHNLSGVQLTPGRAAVSQIALTALRMPWAATLRVAAVSSIWFGNSSATLFDGATVTVMLALLAAAALSYLFFARRTRRSPAEWIVMAALLSYSAGLAYSAVLIYRATATIAATPWYTQVLFPPGMCLLLLGAARASRIGEVVRLAMLALWTYVIAATYFAKLIPLYAGYPTNAVRAAALFRWYWTSWREANAVLATVSLMPPFAIWLLAGSVALGGACLAIVLSRAKI